MTDWIGGGYTAADFDAGKAPRSIRKAAETGQDALFATGTPSAPPKRAAAPAPRLDGEVSLFGDDDQDQGAGHVPDPDPGHGAFDVCRRCRVPIVQHWERREVWVTMTGGRSECPGRPVRADY